MNPSRCKPWPNGPATTIWQGNGCWDGIDGKTDQIRERRRGKGISAVKEQADQSEHD